MNKRKLMLVAVALCMVAILGFGGTLAYLTDKDQAENVFTVGNVTIRLDEIFDEENAKLMPGKDIQKDVKVTNTGSEECYVRVHIAIPSKVNDGDPEQNASNNFLHFNFETDSVGAGYWSWNENVDGANYPTTGADWNFYTATINNEAYDVYVVTYKTALKANEQTKYAAMTKVYMDPTVDATTEGTTITFKDNQGNVVVMDKNDTLSIFVVAQAVQKEGFDDAYAAFDAAYAANNLSNPWQ